MHFNYHIELELAGQHYVLQQSKMHLAFSDLTCIVLHPGTSTDVGIVFCRTSMKRIWKFCGQ